MSTGPWLSPEAHPSKQSFPRHRYRQNHRLFSVLHGTVLHLDRTLRRALRIFEFSASQSCLLRIAVVRTRAEVVLPNGTTLHPNDRFVDLHFWNEHVEQVFAGRGPCARAKSICRHLHRSLELLAEYLLAHPELDVKALHARVVMPIGDRLGKFEALAGRYGFSVTPSSSRGMMVIHDFFEDFLVRALAWAFNANQRKHLPLRRADLWVERDQFWNQYLRSRMRDSHGRNLQQHT